MTADDTASLVPVDIAGAGTLLALDDGTTKWIAIRPVCEQLGIDAEAQRQRLDQAEWACTCVSQVQLPGSGQSRAMFMIDADHLPMWLATIQTSRVTPSARVALTLYQREAARALRDYFYRGVAVSGSRSRLDTLQLMVDQLRETERIAEQSQRDSIQAMIDAGVAKALGEKANARIDGIEGNHGWFSALAYARLYGHRTESGHLNTVGRQAALIGRREGLTAGTSQHARYGAVNTWPEEIWAEAFRMTS